PRPKPCSRTSKRGADGRSAESRSVLYSRTMPPSGGLGFFGRASECRRLDGMLAQARDGRSSVLVIRGEPGIGKTALLRYAARQASGLRLARVEGVHAEMELPFAAIHRLCAPLLGGLDVLPKPQQDALSVALGVSPGSAPDR